MAHFSKEANQPILHAWTSSIIYSVFLDPHMPSRSCFQSCWGLDATALSWWNLTTMHVMLSALPRVKATSVNFWAAASGSSSSRASETASWHHRWTSIQWICQLKCSKNLIASLVKKQIRIATFPLPFFFLGALIVWGLYGIKPPHVNLLTCPPFLRSLFLNTFTDWTVQTMYGSGDLFLSC